MTETIRPGEIRASIDPANKAGDAQLVFIGQARTQWTLREECPKNIREARERGGSARIEIEPEWRPGLHDLSAGEAIIVLTWMHRARRDLVIQAPRHSPRPTSVFSIRSPVRPNPIGLSVVRLVACDAASGILQVDALDCLDGTPVLDIKPWRKGVDVPPDSAPAR
jgi:tRNA-Thr(GGU) m(6)t(6)A37 methyltransferase TsaA